MEIPKGEAIESLVSKDLASTATNGKPSSFDAIAIVVVVDVFF